MHSVLINGYQLLFDALTVLEPHMGTSFFLFFTSFSTFSFYVFVTLTSLFLFLGASLVCVNNLKEDNRFSLLIPWQDICLYTPLAWSLYSLIVLKASLSPTKLKTRVSCFFFCILKYFLQLDLYVSFFLKKSLQALFTFIYFS